MGALHYGTQRLEFDDRTLVHLQIVISSKLQRGEGFLLSWIADENGWDARRSIWLSHSIPLAFTFETSRVGVINRAWVHELELRANTGHGLTVTPEPLAENALLPEYEGGQAR